MNPGLIDLTDITTQTIAALAFSAALALLTPIRKRITATIRRRKNRLIRLIKIRQCLPGYTLQQTRLLRQLNQTTSINAALHTQIEQLNLQMAQKSNQLTQSQNDLLLLASTNERWHIDQLVKSLGWNIQFTKMIVEQCESLNLIKRTSKHIITRVSLTRELPPPQSTTCTYYFLTAKGRAHLFSAGLIVK